MCGIVGFIDKKNQLSPAGKKRLIVKMRKLIDYRGKDSRGEFIYKNIAFGHTRLSIIGLNRKGSQPMFSRDKNLAIIYNGEIYNYLELNKNLRIKTVTDTETILNSYAKWGINCLNYFKGMFAFAILDKKKQKLCLAIDRFGIKPIYFINNDNWFGFASEIKALFLLPEVKPQLNTKALPEYLLYRSISGKDTLFRGIEKMLPAQFLEIDLKTNQLKIKKYWELKKHKLPEALDYKNEFLKLMKASAKEHLVADAPIGLQLSGGIDSSLIAALASKIKTAHFHSFSIGLKNKNWNEFSFSRLVAKKLKTIHHELKFGEKDFCELLPKMTYHMDEPINHPHSVPMHILSKNARRYVKVLLSGEGADEVFGGYRRYEKINPAKKLSDKFLIELAKFGDEKILKKIANFNLQELPKYKLQILKKYRNESNINKISALDIETYLVPLLIRQDKMGMAANIENRVPFLDHKVVEFAFSLPEKLKLNLKEKEFFRTKPLLKEAASQLVSLKSIYRRKIGFGLPISLWLRNKNGLGKYLEMFNKQKRNFLNYREIKKIIVEHQSGKKNHGETLWILLNLELWMKIFIDGVNPSKIYLSLRP